MRGMHGGGSRVPRLFGAGLGVAGMLLGAGHALAQGVGQGALACYQRAEREVSLSSEQALRLCQGATSAAPAECYIASQAPATFLDPEDAVALCRCAASTGPVACYQRADKETFLDTTEILRLCSPSLTYNLMSDCLPGVTPLWPY